MMRLPGLGDQHVLQRLALARDLEVRVTMGALEVGVVVVHPPLLPGLVERQLLGEQQHAAADQAVETVRTFVEYYHEAGNRQNRSKNGRVKLVSIGESAISESETVRS